MSHGRKQRKSRQGKARRTDLIHTPLAKHQKVGKNVVPPLAMLARQLPMVRTDWAGDRLPEMLWASLLIAGHGRDAALDAFRAVATYIRATVEGNENSANDLSDVTLTGLAKWSDEDFVHFVQIVVAPSPGLFSGLASFEQLPHRERWLTAIGDAGDPADLEPLAHAVAITYWHQSQDATDCRWMRVIAMMAAGKLLFPTGAEEMVRELIEYPHFGDQKAVRPTIRANEGALHGLRGNGKPPAPSVWSSSFWNEAFEKTRDSHMPVARRVSEPGIGITRDNLDNVRAAIVSHSHSTLNGTTTDAKHDASFGLVLYAVDILNDLLALGNGTRIVGRMGLRSITEARITLAYLANHPDAAAWDVYRAYGVGQAKLAYLKLLDTETLPGFVTVENLEHLANEDLWHEFQEIKLGNWDGSDLRKMSEKAQMKSSVYDRYYDWTSAFIHANWGAVRDAAFDLCLNPLHRFHRIPTSRPSTLPDVVSDAWLLVEAMLADLEALYPGLPVQRSHRQQEET